MTTQESSLIQRAKQGDHTAFAEIYEANYTKIYSYVYYRVTPKEQAEDIAAEVFVRLVNKIDTYKDQGRPILAWLYTIAGNLIRDHYRKDKRYQFDSIDNEDNYFELTDDSDANDLTYQIDLNLTSEQLAKAIQQLTEEQSQVIILKFVQGWSNKEIAHALNKQEGSIKSLQFRALRTLKKNLDDSEFEFHEGGV